MPKWRNSKYFGKIVIEVRVSNKLLSLMNCTTVQDIQEFVCVLMRFLCFSLYSFSRKTVTGYQGEKTPTSTCCTNPPMVNSTLFLPPALKSSHPMVPCCCTYLLMVVMVTPNTRMMVSLRRSWHDGHWKCYFFLIFWHIKVLSEGCKEFKGKDL